MDQLWDQPNPELSFFLRCHFPISSFPCFPFPHFPFLLLYRPDKEVSSPCLSSGKPQILIAIDGNTFDSCTLHGGMQTMLAPCPLISSHVQSMSYRATNIGTKISVPVLRLAEMVNSGMHTTGLRKRCPKAL